LGFMSIMLAIKDVADVWGVSERAIQLRVKNGDFRVKEVQGKVGRSGKSYLIDITSLPSEIQKRYIESTCKGNEQREKPVIEAGGKTYSLGELAEIYGEEKLKEYLLEAFKKIDIIERIKALGHGSKGKEIERICQEHGYSARSMQRWTKDYEEKGLMGLLRQPREDRGQSIKLCEDAISFIRGFYLQGFEPKGSHVYKQYLKKAKQEGWEIVSDDTIYREIYRIPEDQKNMGRGGVKAYNALSMPKVTRNLNSLKINEIWVGDGHTIAVLSPHNNSIRRFTLIAWMDMRSRAMVGWCIGKHSSGYIIGLALRHGILPKDDSPICGLPGTVYMDNGKDYKSKHLHGGTKSKMFDFSLEQEGLLKQLQIEKIFATVEYPWAKPIERQFQTFSSDMSRFLVGFCGESIDRRPYNLDEKEILVSGLSIEQLAEIIEGYMRVYNNSPHKGLGNKTPLEVYASCEKIRADMPREEELDILMLKSEKVSITPSGIRKFNVLYWDDALIHHDGEKATVRYDPNRLGELYVYLNGTLHCIATNKELLEMNGTEEKVKEWRKKQARARKETREAINAYGVSEGEARRMVVEDYTDDEEILDIVCGRTSAKKSSNSKVVRLNKATHEGRKLNDTKGKEEASCNDYFAKLGEEYFKTKKIK